MCFDTGFVKPESRGAFLSQISELKLEYRTRDEICRSL